MNSEESGRANMKEDWGLGEGAEEEDEIEKKKK